VLRGREVDQPGTTSHRASVRLAEGHLGQRLEFKKSLSFPMGDERALQWAVVGAVNQ